MRSRSNTFQARNIPQPAALDPAAVAAVDRRVGIRLQRRRTLLGLSQQEVAAKMGLSFQQLQKYERGINRISASRLYQLAQILEARVADFFEDGVAGTGPEAGPRSEVQELLSAFRALETESQRRAFAQLLTSMKRSERN